MVRGLVVDKRIHEVGRLTNMVAGEGGTLQPFIEGKGMILAGHEYHQISPTPPVGWPCSMQGYYHFRAIRGIVQDAKDDGADHVLIIEDDCVFTPEFHDVVEAATQEIADRGIEWDILYYGANHMNAATKDVSDHVMKVNGSLTTHCFGVRKNAFNYILALPPKHMIDKMIADNLHSTLDCYGLWPNVALQKPGLSTLWNINVDYTELFKFKGRQV